MSIDVGPLISHTNQHNGRISVKAAELPFAGQQPLLALRGWCIMVAGMVAWLLERHWWQPSGHGLGLAGPSRSPSPSFLSCCPRFCISFSVRFSCLSARVQYCATAIGFAYGVFRCIGLAMLCAMMAVVLLAAFVEGRARVAGMVGPPTSHRRS